MEAMCHWYTTWGRKFNFKARCLVGLKAGIRCHEYCHCPKYKPSDSSKYDYSRLDDPVSLEKLPSIYDLEEASLLIIMLRKGE